MRGSGKMNGTVFVTFTLQPVVSGIFPLGAHFSVCRFCMVMQDFYFVFRH